MVNSTRICKVCGKEYPYCKTALKDGEIFHYQDVACCPEHGSEYFAQILASRGEKPAEQESECIVSIPEEIDDNIDDDDDEDEEDVEEDE